MGLFGRKKQESLTDIEEWVYRYLHGKSTGAWPEGLKVEVSQGQAHNDVKVSYGGKVWQVELQPGQKVPSDWMKPTNSLAGYQPGDKIITGVTQGPSGGYSRPIGYENKRGDKIYQAANGNVVEDPAGKAKPYVIKQNDDADMANTVARAKTAAAGSVNRSAAFTGDGADTAGASTTPWHTNPNWTKDNLAGSAATAGINTDPTKGAYAIEQRADAAVGTSTIYRMSDGTYKVYDPKTGVSGAGTWNANQWNTSDVGKDAPITVAPTQHPLTITDVHNRPSHIGGPVMDETDVGPVPPLTPPPPADPFKGAHDRPVHIGGPVTVDDGDIVPTTTVTGTVTGAETGAGTGTGTSTSSTTAQDLLAGTDPGTQSLLEQMRKDDEAKKLADDAAAVRIAQARQNRMSALNIDDNGAGGKMINSPPPGDPYKAAHDRPVHIGGPVMDETVTSPATPLAITEPVPPSGPLPSPSGSFSGFSTGPQEVHFRGRLGRFTAE